MPKLSINGKEVEVPSGSTVLQACQVAGVEIPHFCYHDRLSIAGNCRMCLVEMEKSPKPIASCAMPAAEGMVIYTDSEKTRRARKGVMEFLLINHPLDCPICDQGGECDLQDEAMAYGFDRGRYAENKRAVKDKEFGPLIKTSMTRCIHCTRCVRFATDIAGVSELGATGRGETMEVGTYIERALTSELSGNMIDLCPVGALTSKPYSFVARPWELRKTESIDVLDAVGSNIRIDVRGPQVMRILPRIHESLNEEWLGDKSRFSLDGLLKRRIDRPYVRRNGKLVEATWEEAFISIKNRIQNRSPSKFAALAGDLCDVESMFVLKDLMKAIGCNNIDCRQDGAKLDASVRSSYLFNSTIAEIDNTDLVLLVGTNMRAEASLISARLRKRYLRGGLRIASIGPNVDMTFPVTDLGCDINILNELLNGEHHWFSLIREAKKPMIIIGMGALTREDGSAVLSMLRKIAEKTGIVRKEWNGFNILHTSAARVGGLDIDFVSNEKDCTINEILSNAQSGEIDTIFLLGVDEIMPDKFGSAFVIYQGHHGDRGALRADVVLPGAAYTEKNGLYVNMEGRPQIGRAATHPPGQAKEDWRIIRALAEFLGIDLEYRTLSELRTTISSKYPFLKKIDTISAAEWGEFGSDGELLNEPIRFVDNDYYASNVITRSSETMLQCKEAFKRNPGTIAGKKND